MNYPGYTFSNTLSGALNMTNVPVMLLGIILNVVGHATSVILVWLIGMLMIAVQVVSRLRVVKGMRMLRDNDGTAEVLYPDPNVWAPLERLIRIELANLPYADPWRPITLGYPALILHFGGASRVELLFPYGMELARNEALDLLVERFPNARVDIED